jgi:GDP-L-fucose synthase
VCSYPKYTSVPFTESQLWDGYPEETNAAYGLAKKALLTQLTAYRTQYGFNGIYLVPENLYGPGDTFDEHDSHVIPALIRKMITAKHKKAKSVTIWGTGRATREFLFVTDAARAVLLAAEKYNGGEPVNIGARGEISIRELADLIAHYTGFTGEIRFDGKRPDGQPRRALDTTRAAQFFGFRARVPFSRGLPQTIQWYTTHKDA